MKFKFTAMAALFATNAIAGPFGLDMGMSHDEISQQVKIEEIKQFRYVASSLPKGHPNMESYVLLITPELGLCKISAISNTIKSSAYGEEIRNEFKSFESALVKKYGNGEKYDFLRAGSIWNAPREWMMSLLRGDRTLMRFWKSGKKKKLPDNIEAILIKSHALSIESGYTSIDYEFTNNEKCIKFVEDQENSSL